MSPKQISRIDENLRERLSARRYEHVCSVRDLAVALARVYGSNEEHVTLAALLHDCVKWQTPEQLLQTAASLGMRLDPFDLRFPKILHAIVGAEIARIDYAIEIPDILAAIRQHTTGDANMTLLAKIIYVADYAEPLRTHDLAPTIREKALSGSLQEACLIAVDGSIKHLIEKGVLIHPRTIAAHNSLIEQLQSGLVELKNGKEEEVRGNESMETTTQQSIDP